MARGPGIKAKWCYCFVCKRNFKACREDADTCSAKCRKAKNRLLGNGDSTPTRQELDKRGTNGVTEKPNAHGPFRVMLNGKWVASYPTYDRAALAVASWLEEWDGDFEIKAAGKKR